MTAVTNPPLLMRRAGSRPNQGPKSVRISGTTNPGAATLREMRDKMRVTIGSQHFQRTKRRCNLPISLPISEWLF